MGIIDDLKHKAEELGEKAKEGLDVARDRAGDLLDDAKDKAGDLVEDVKERLGHDEQDEHDGARAPMGESDDIGPDSSSTDAVQPGYVTGEDAEDAGGSDEAAADEGAEDADAGSYESDAQSDELVPDADVDTDAPGAVAPDVPAGPSGDAPLAPVATDVDPYDEPLSESIGSELSDSDREALAGAVDDGTDRDS